MMSWLTFHSGRTVVKKRPVDKKLDRYHRLLHRRLGIGISM